MSADKEISEVLKRFAECADRLTFVSPRYPRCVKASDLLEIYESRVKPLFIRDARALPHVEIIDELCLALRQRESHAVTLVTGSCFLVGEARAWLLGVPFPELGVITTAR